MTTAGLMDRQEAAEYLGVAPGTLANWQSTQLRQVPCVKLGRVVRYRQGDLDRWIDANSQNRVATIEETRL